MLSKGFSGTEMPKDIIREKLLIAINEYKITLNTLNKVTGIDINWLSDYINSKNEIHDLPMEKNATLFEVTILLTEGIKMVSEDERIKGVIDVLVEIFGLNYETISLYAGLEKQDIENFMKDTTLIGYEKKYKLATASMILHYIFKNPNYHYGESDAEMDRVIKSSNSYKTLFHRILLKVLGYAGEYIDYSLLGLPTKPIDQVSGNQ